MFYWNIVKPQLTRVFFCHFCILLQFMTFSVVGVTISLQTPLAQIMASRHMRLAQVQRKDGFEARLQGVSGRSGRENGQNGPLNLDLAMYFSQMWTCPRSIVVKRKIYKSSRPITKQVWDHAGPIRVAVGTSLDCACHWRHLLAHWRVLICNHTWRLSVESIRNFQL